MITLSITLPLGRSFRGFLPLPVTDIPRPDDFLVGKTLPANKSSQAINAQTILQCLDK
jgi:hypothetical protein